MSSKELWGIAVVDWNGDGCDDLYVGRHNTKVPRLYRNECPGLFVDEVWRLGIPDPPVAPNKDRHTATLGDFDGDNRVDIHVPTGAKQGRGSDNDQLFRQNSDGTFTDVAPALGMTDPLGSGRQAVWLDYDGNGFLDLLLVHKFWSNRLEDNRHKLWAQSAGVFSEVAVAAGIGAQETGAAVTASDIDLDGDPDVIVTPGTKTSLFRNIGGGKFRKESLGIAASGGAAVGDYDNDGDLDIFLCTNKASALLRSDAGIWASIGQAAGVATSFAISAVWVDVNNDGWLDLYVVRKRDPNTGQNLPDRLYINNGNGVFADAAVAAGVAGPSEGRGDSAAWGDVNRDGYPDLFAANTSANPSVVVYRNESGTNGWITLRLQNPLSSNGLAIGTIVWITAGGITQVREHVIFNGFRSQSAQYVHVGLGLALMIDELRIRWPDGAVETYAQLPVNRHYVAVKGTGQLRY